MSTAAYIKYIARYGSGGCFAVQLPFVLIFQQAHNCQIVWLRQTLAFLPTRRALVGWVVPVFAFAPTSLLPPSWGPTGIRSTLDRLPLSHPWSHSLMCSR